MLESIIQPQINYIKAISGSGSIAIQDERNFIQVDPGAIKAIVTTAWLMSREFAKLKGLQKDGENISSRLTASDIGADSRDLLQRQQQDNNLARKECVKSIRSICTIDDIDRSSCTQTESREIERTELVNALQEGKFDVSSDCYLIKPLKRYATKLVDRIDCIGQSILDGDCLGDFRKAYKFCNKNMEIQERGSMLFGIALASLSEPSLDTDLKNY